MYDQHNGASVFRRGATFRRFVVSLALIASVATVGLARPVAEALGDRVGLYYADPEAKASALPSLALVVPRAGEPQVQRSTLVPVFFARDGHPGFKLAVRPGTSLYGAGESAGPLLRNGRKIITWNTDAYNYKASTPSLYQSHPWVLGVGANGASFGVLADTTYRVTMDLPGVEGGDLVMTSDGPAFPVIVIERESPQGVLRALADLVGKMPLPPKWAMGFQQCRFSYSPDSRVREVASEFRKRSIPCDVIWHDIDYMDGYRCFTFSPKDFPDPTQLNADLRAQGFHTVWMIDPGIKAQPGYGVYDRGTAADVWVKTADGKTNFEGKVWPGMCVFPDFTRRDVRQWWGGLYKDFLATGIDGVWNDMNEPAVFDVKSKTMPEDNLHRADAELGGPGPHARYHNVYGMLMARATREGIQAARPDKRPFVLTRANFMGGHRYAAAWTGDNSANWFQLRTSVPMVLNLGLSGQPFSGPDIGGYKGNGPEGAEGPFFARWMGFGAMLPFARAHTEKESKPKEPWAFGPEVEAACRTAIERRYRLLPYYYTLFREASVNGLPVARPVFFADPADAALRTQDSAFLLGDSVMVCPELDANPGAPTAPPLAWTEFWNAPEGQVSSLPRLFIRPGAIVPNQGVVQYVDEKPLEELRLLVCLDKRNRATGTMYEDAGDGYGYQKGDFRFSTFVAELEGDELVVREAKHEGERKRTWSTLVVDVIGEAGAGNPFKSVRVVLD